MRTISRLLVVTLVFVSLLPATISLCQPDTLPKPHSTAPGWAQTATLENKIGIGVQATSPVIGISVKYQAIPNVNLIGALGLFNTFTTAGVRAEAFQKHSNYNALCYISYGSGSYDGKFMDKTGSSWHGAGFGVGFEYFPYVSRIIGLSFDFGFLKYIHTDPKERNYATINGGGAIHYYIK